MDLIIAIEVVSLICIIVTSRTKKIYQMDDKKEFIAYAKKKILLVSGIFSFALALNIHIILMPSRLLGKQLDNTTGPIALFLILAILVIMCIFNRKVAKRVGLILNNVIDTKNTYERVWELKENSDSVNMNDK